LESLILEHVAAETNALPLLEFAFQQLWERRDQQQHRLTVAVYEEMGCFMGALNQYATDWFKTLTAADQVLTKRVLLSLVRVGVDEKDTRWRRKRNQILDCGDQEVDKIVDLLSEKRLIVQDNDQIDLAHERLMDGWKLFAEWRQENRDLQRLSQRIKDAQTDWQVKGKSGDYLMWGGFLTEVIEQLPQLEVLLTTAEQDFCQNSIKEFKKIDSTLTSVIASLKSVIESDQDAV
jgi:hypothetical protein